MKNPFNPLFGRKPELFYGREQIINSYIMSKENLNDPNSTTIITGLRGSGKTSLLSDISDTLSSDKTNICVEVTAHDGMLRDILTEISLKGKRFLNNKLGSLQSFNVGAVGFSFGFSRFPKEELGFRHSLQMMLDELSNHGICVIFILDEVHNDTPDMREFAITYQHMLREKKDVMLLIAGLPSSVFDVLNDKVLTFLRRANRILLENISIEIVRLEYKQIFNMSFPDIDEKYVDRIATVSMGYPYLIQLLGYNLWNQFSAANETSIEMAIALSKETLFKDVHDLVWYELSEKDKEFLIAMSVDERESKFADILLRLGVEKNYATKYRARLLDAGIVESSGRGLLVFTLPFMREYVLRKSEMC